MDNLPMATKYTMLFRYVLAGAALIALGVDAAMDSWSFGAEFSALLGSAVGWLGLRRPGDKAALPEG
jgi:hypothetical protein